MRECCAFVLSLNVLRRHVYGEEKKMEEDD